MMPVPSGPRLDGLRARVDGVQQMGVQHVTDGI